MPRYICVGCVEIHDDNDYCKSDGDIILNEQTIKCLNQFFNKEYEENLKEYPDAKRSFELYHRLKSKIRERNKLCVKENTSESQGGKN